jgi:hypothetical protein
MLDSHPDVAVPLDVTGLWWRFEAEIPRFGDLAVEAARRAIVDALLDEPRIRLWNVPLAADEVLARWSAPGYPGLIAAFYEAYAAHFGKRHWGDKDPGNMTRIDVLNRWFPECRVIHIIRDGRAACASLVKQDFGPDDLLQCADQWREEVSWMRRIGRLLGPRCFEVRYESLVTSPAETLQGVCGFLGLPFADDMLHYNARLDQSIPEDKRHIWPLIGDAPRADNAERWRQSMPRSVQVCFEKRAGELLAELGYATSGKPWRGQYGTEFGFLAARIVRTLRHRFAR